jgi:hypothetical protein
MSRLDTVRLSHCALEERLLISVEGVVDASESNSTSRRRKLCREDAKADDDEPGKKRMGILLESSPESSPQSVITGANMQDIPSVRKAVLAHAEGSSYSGDDSADLSCDSTTTAASDLKDSLPETSSLPKTDEMTGPSASTRSCPLEQVLNKHMPGIGMPSFSAHDRALMLKLIMSTGSCDHGLDKCVAAFHEVLPDELIPIADSSGSQ